MSAVEVLEGLSPEDLGLDPQQFPSFRAEQLEAIEAGVYGEERVQALGAPGGIGKSLVAWCIAKLIGGKSLILTRDHGLTKQYMDDFERYGLVEIKGRSNYACQEGWGTCEDGAHWGCESLGEKPPSCVYWGKKQEAIRAQVKLTNYKYHLYSGMRTSAGLGAVDTLICDEAHFLDKELADFMQVRLWEWEIRKLMHDVSRPKREDIGEWRQWAGLNLPSMKEEVKARKQRAVELKLSGDMGLAEVQVKLSKQLEGLTERLAALDSTVDDEWVCEMYEGGQWGRYWNFDPVGVGRYTESRVFRGAKRVVLMSATLNRETLRMLGVRKEESRFLEWRRIFPAQRHPVYLLPTYKEVARTSKNPEGRAAIAVNYTISDQDMKAVMETMDQFLDLRLDRKGLIQTVSYRRQETVMELSRHRGIMIGNTKDPESEDARKTAEKFRKAKAPSILVSPSFSTGWDFKFTACEYIVLLNIPFKPAQTKVAKARYEKYPRLRDYEALQEFWQSTFRGMRDMKDRCEVLILDGRAAWFLSKTKDMSPRGMVDNLRKVTEIPQPPPKLIVAEIA